MRLLVGSVLFPAALLIVVLGGCGGSSPAHSSEILPSAETLIHELEGWTGEAERLTSEVDHGRVPATDFHPPGVLLSPSDLRDVSPNGFRIGVSTDFSVIEMDDSTYLTLQEVKNLYCFFFSWYLKHGTYPEPQEFDEALYSYISGRVIPRTPHQRLEGAANLLREAIENAQSSGEAVRNTAIATVCTVPSRR